MGAEKLNQETAAVAVIAPYGDDYMQPISLHRSLSAACKACRAYESRYHATAWITALRPDGFHALEKEKDACEWNRKHFKQLTEFQLKTLFGEAVMHC